MELTTNLKNPPPPVQRMKLESWNILKRKQIKYQYRKLKPRSKTNINTTTVIFNNNKSKLYCKL